MTLVDFLLIVVTSLPGSQVQVLHVNTFTTRTACEAAAQSMRQGIVTDTPERQFVCLKTQR